MKVVRPLNDFVLIKRQAMEATTKGGLIIPDTNQTKSLYGEVLAIGPGKYKKGTSERLPMTLKAGDVILFRGVTSVVGEIGTVDGDGLLMLHEEDIEAIVVEP